MSINVTVNGNPVNIKKGKMVTSDPYSVKQEFDKRRLMRLEQVRKQSKELAENIRNKVKKEKQKQIGKLEKEGKEKHRSWQNRKLQELQAEYRQALSDIGLGHNEANKLETDSEILEKQKQKNAKVAKIRGKIAAAKLELQKKEENERKRLQRDQKYLARDIENTRAAFVSSTAKRKGQQTKQGKTKAKINITVSSDSDVSDDEEEEDAESSNELNNITEEGENDNINDKDKSEGNNNSVPEPQINQNLLETQKEFPASHTSISLHSKQIPDKSEIKEKTYQQSIDERKKRIESYQQQDIPMETRISDRIKLRKVMAEEPDFCDFSSAIKIAGGNNSDCICRKNVVSCPCKSHTDSTQAGYSYSQHPGKESRGMDAVNTKVYVPSRFALQSENIPSKPTIKLKESTASRKSEVSNKSQTASDIPKVRHYDHFNKFEHVMPSTAQVIRVDSDSLEVIPNVTSELELRELMKKRDREAELRGKRALEKEKIKRDYEELMRQLPILQRKENLLHIGTDKPEYHMSEERLKELERQKQNRLENAYLKTIPDIKPEIVTIPRRKPESLNSDEPFHILDGDDSRALNLGKWDTDTRKKKMFSAEEVQEIIKAFSFRKPEDRRAKLKQLLRDLKIQKEQLLNEIKILPNNDSINALIDDLNSFSEPDRKHVKKVSSETQTKRKRAVESTSSSSEAESLKKNEKNSTDKPKKTPVKKIRAARQVLVLQNTSTQTSPKATKETIKQVLDLPEKSEPPFETIETKSTNLCKKTHAVCDCIKENGHESVEELCKIFIKLQGEATPEVQIVKKSRNSLEREESRKEDAIVTSADKKEKSNTPKIEFATEPAKKISTKSVATETDRISVKPTKPPKEIIQEAKLPTQNIRRPIERHKPTWREHLSKNSVLSTSSTSYLSPPDFSTVSTQQPSKLSLYNVQNKPQQTSINASASSMKMSRDNSRIVRTDSAALQNYVKQLLNMSKASVEELQMSSSDILTPSQSVIEIESNNPLAALHDVIKFINRKAAGVEKNATQMPSDQSQVLPDSLRTQTNSKIEESQMTDSKTQTTESNYSRYADVADSCSKRIANISAMIEKIRKEKVEIIKKPTLEQVQRNEVITPTFSDKDYSTKYLDVPQYSSEKESTSPPSSEEEEFHKKLLEIDMSLAEKLKKFRRQEPDRDPPAKMTESNDVLDDADQDFLLRLQKLMAADYEKDQAAKKQNSKEINGTGSNKYVPVLLDIPKLPILEPMPESQSLSDSGRKHPPPSKGLISAKKFNGNISLIPHELSTIAEADSQLSTKISPNTSKMSRSPSKDVVSKLNVLPEQKAEEKPAKSDRTNEQIPREVSEEKIKSNDQPKELSPLENSSCSCRQNNNSKSPPCTDVTSDSSKKSTSSTNSGDMASIEAMLRSIGMDWAIPTLHKTQNALALSSSSSSTDLNSGRNRTTKSNSSSEISLKNFLKKQMLNKISSSSLTSDASPGSFLQESNEISSINPNSFQSDTTKKRTSTPLSKCKKTISNKSRNDQPIFSGSSDISSVKEESLHSKSSNRKLENEPEFHTL